jgi:predicted nucleic acid-binding protein
MRTGYTDAGYWIALVNPGDDLHYQAKSVSAALAPMRMITSEMVLAEVLNSFSKKGVSLRKTTTNLINDIKTDSMIEIISQTSELFNQALRLYEDRLDQTWSLTDCASFYIMQQRNMFEALTHDRHFEQAGFIALLR